MAGAAERGWLGHPRGLSTLFFTEMWERFSYYGMRSLLILYMTALPAAGGLGFSTEKGATIYGWYTGLVYLTSLPGGWVADRYLGHYRSVLLGGIIIALGHFTLALHPLPFFYLGLFLVIVGTGLLKPNISTMVGSLYEEGDRRRDAGFSIFYMGINLGAFAAPFVCGTLGQKVDWHVGFAAAGVGMVLGLVQYVLGGARLRPGLERLRKNAGARQGAAAGLRLSAEEWRRIAVIVILFIFASIFWASFEQAGSSLNLFADRHTRLPPVSIHLPYVYDYEGPMPSTWFQAINGLFIILLAPVFGWLWVRLGPHEPSSPVKFALGLLFVGLGFLLLVPAAQIATSTGERVSPLWLVGLYLLHTIGELCLSPVGLSLVTKLAPSQIAGSMMGVWFLSNAVGNYLGGWIAGYFDQMPLPKLFGAVFATSAGAALLLFLLVKPIQRMAGGIR